MSIAHIVTRGIGPDAAIKGILTAGILGGAADETAPTVSSATINTAGTTITFAFSESVVATISTGFALTMSGGAVTATYSSGTGSSSLVYTLSRTVQYGETGTHAYTQPGNGIEDTSGNDLDTYSGAAVTNNSTDGQDVTAPTVSTRTVSANGTTFTIACSETVSVGAGGNGGFTLTPTNGGAAVTLSYASGSGSANLVYTASRAITRNETLTLAYVQPGNGIEDAAGNDLASFSGQAVTNNSTQNTAATDISLSSTTVSTSGGVNTVVGTLSNDDPDPGDTFTYTLVAGTGDVDNAFFSISGSSLRCDDPSGLTPDEYFVRVQVSDGVATYAEAFSIFVIEPGTVAIFNRGLIITDIIQPVVREVIQ
jgi:hypothetical protein